MNSTAQADIVALEHVQIFQYVDVASIAILVLDYSLTLDLEVDLLWPSEWSIQKILFLITRYLPLVDSAILLYRTFTENMSLHTCDMAYKANTLLILIGVVIAEIILSTRTWAVWGRKRNMAIGLVIFSIVSAVPAIPVITRFSSSVQFSDPPISNFRGCYLTGGSRILSMDWILLMVYDSVLLTLMIIRAFKAMQLPDNPTLLKVVLRDGIMYYVYLFVLSTLNVIIIWALPVDFINLFSMLERVVHSVLTCRVVLSIRAEAKIVPTSVYTSTGLDFGSHGVEEGSHGREEESHGREEESQVYPLQDIENRA